MSREVRVLFLADAVFEDKPGGSRVVARELARRLTSRGHAVTFLVARHDPDALADERTTAGVRVVRYAGAGRAGAFVRVGRAACARLLAEQPFDIVHTHFAYAAVGPLQVVSRHVPCVRSFYGPWDAEGWVEDMARAGDKTGPVRVAYLAKSRLRKRLRHAVEAANLRRSDRTLVLSEQSRGEVRAFGYPDARIVLAPGGVDTERFRPAGDKASVRRTLGLPHNQTLLLSVRRLAPRMGLDNLIAALPKIVCGRSDALLVIGGTGPERENLEELARRLGLLDTHVRFTGFLPDEQLAAYYQAADLFVLPTLALEGFGLVTVEALACGTPVVGTPVGATLEILGGLDKRLVTTGTAPDALAAGVLDFLNGDWGRALSADRLHDFVQNRYTWERHADAVESVYRDALAGRPRSRRQIEAAAAAPESAP